MIKIITSSDNKTLKLVRSLRRKKIREREGLYFAEGVRLTDEALVSVPDAVRFLIVSEEYAAKNDEKIKSLDNNGKIVYITRDNFFDDICDTETPQGIAAVIEMPRQAPPDFSQMKYILILDGVSEPGNMGTIIRTAEAAGIEAICLLDGCADIYNSKTVRASMGSLFRMKFCRSDLDTVAEIKKCGFEIAATALYNSQPIEAAAACSRRALVIGSEAHGVSGELLAQSDISVRIDMCGKVESLNAAVAAGIAMYMLRPSVQQSDNLIS